MKNSLLVFLLVFPSLVFAQSHFEKNKAKVKSELEKYSIENISMDPVLTVTDSTLVLTVTEPGQHRIVFIYGFDGQTGECNAERTEADCSVCYKKYINKLLDQKTYKWKKLNENQYASRFEDRLLLESGLEENDYSFILFKTRWTKDFYELLIKE